MPMLYMGGEEKPKATPFAEWLSPRVVFPLLAMGGAARALLQGSVPAICAGAGAAALVACVCVLAPKR